MEGIDRLFACMSMTHPVDMVLTLCNEQEHVTADEWMCMHHRLYDMWSRSKINITMEEYEQGLEKCTPHNRLR